MRGVRLGTGVHPSVILLHSELTVPTNVHPRHRQSSVATCAVPERCAAARSSAARQNLRGNPWKVLGQSLHANPSMALARSRREDSWKAWVIAQTLHGDPSVPVSMNEIRIRRQDPHRVPA